MKEKKFTYSKSIPIVTGIIFIACLARGLSVDLKDIVDTAVFVTSISVSGAIFGTSLVNYSKKASMENAYKMRTVFYKSSVKERLKFNEEMMKLKLKYNMTDEDVDYINANGEVDEMMEDAYTSARNLAEQNIEQSETVIDLQSFNL